MSEIEGFFDHDSMDQLIEKIVDVLRPLGLTVHLEGVAMTAAQGQQFLMLPVQVRPSAKTKLAEDKASREAFNKMLAEQHEQMIRDKADRIRQVASDPQKLEEYLMGEIDNDCTHENKHPDGFCLDCGEGME